MDHSIAVAIVLALSIIIQTAAAIAAFRLIGITGSRLAWSLISAALALMAVRRAVPLYRLITGDLSVPPDMLNEVIGLALSVAMAVGIVRIAPLFTERRREKDALRESVAFPSSLLDAIPIPVFHKDRNGRYLGFNKAYETFFGATRDQLIGKTVFDINPRELAEIYHAKDMELIEDGGVQQYESQVKNTHGVLRDVIFNKAVFTDSRGTVAGLIGAILDITERKRAEEELHRLNRELRAISKCNQTLMRAEDEQTLLNDVCQIVCDEAGYRLVWAGYAEHDDGKTIRPVAWAGAEDGYLAETGLTWADTERGRGPCGIAICSGESICIQDFTSTPQAAPWRDNALQRGYRSSIALPLKDESGNAFGVINIYSTEPNAFTPDEIRLLNELAGDLAFGIMVLRARVENKRAEQERLAYLRLVESMERINRAIQGTSDLEKMLRDVLAAVLAIFDCDRAWLFYPCDPDAPSFRVPMEIAKPEYPGAGVLNVDVPMPPDMALNLREALESAHPVTYAVGTGKPINQVSAEQFGVKSMMMVAVYPKAGKPWAFGMHQCSSARIWTQEEQRLFQEINRRLADGLTSLLSHRDLQESEAKYRRIVDTATEGIWVLGSETITTFVNARMAEMLGYSGEEMIGRAATDFMFAEDATDHLRRMENRRQDVPENYECRYRHKDGHAVWTLASASPIVDNEHRFMDSFAMLTDITERKRYQEQLERQSNYDDLTGLPNRNLLADRLAHAVERCLREQRKLTVLVLNLDRFGEINDSLGRAVGDSVLRETTERLKGLVRGMDTLARLGADEFVLVGEVGEAQEAASLARRIMEALSRPFRVEGRDISLRTSIGIATLAEDGGNSRALLDDALVALHRVKAAGGSDFLFHSAEMNVRALEHLNLENDLRRAIEHEELVLHYQPKVSLRSGEIVGMEALVRWQHPKRGLVSPMEFIPLAETTGLILPLGEWVMRAACTQNRAWQAAGLPAMVVAVNVSARQFVGQDVVALTRRVLSETGLDPGYLELELTESAAMANTDAFIAITEALKGLSVTVSIDDFGTGYSSLSYLKRFALDRLKIDQSFVRDIVQDPDSAAIVEAVITLAHGLGLLVIAEGVETEGQLNFIRSRGCDEMQGYYFSKPLPAAEFEQLLRDGRQLPLPVTAELPGQTLLLVDDEPSILSALKRQLRREGYHILTATSAAEGMELLANHEVAVVMSDQRMPEMSGAEFLAKVRVMYPDTVRIILSGYADLGSITEVVNRGEIYKFLEKPWSEALLRDTLREAVRHYATRRAER